MSTSPHCISSSASCRIRHCKAIYCDYSSPLKVRGNKIVAGLPDESVAERIAKESGCQLQCYRGENWYAFLPEGSGKVAAIRALTEASGISPDDIAAFGDDLNDVEMLKMCGMGVAVANAIPEVRRIADDVTLSNDQDGVVVWLSCHCLRRQPSGIPWRKSASTCLNVLWQDILSQNRARLPSYFHDDAVIRWHCTNEQFTVAEYVRANCEYPGDWNGEIERAEESGDTAVLAGRVFPPDGGSSFHVVSFIRFRSGKIGEMDEYWADDGPAPAWRREMKIGKPIHDE